MPSIAGTAVSIHSGTGRPGVSVVIDTRKAVAIANEAKAEAAKMHAAILDANTRLAIQVQRAEARALRTTVAAHGRPQRHGPTSNKGLARVLTDERNRLVSTQRITINNPDFLDSQAAYWRQLEYGAQGRTQLLSGLFSEPRRAFSPGARYRSIGNVAPPLRGDRSANRFLQYSVSRRGKPAPKFRALVGPRVEYRYIREGGRDRVRAWEAQGTPVNVYRAAFRRHGISLLATFRGARGRGLSGNADLLSGPS